jgi:hypothetical protein
MTAYVALVAITNVLIGVMLAWYLSPSATLFRPASTLTVPIDPAIELQRVLAYSDELYERKPLGTRGTPEPEAKKPSHAAPIYAKSWADFAHQLHDLKKRTQFCRPAQNMQLARQAAEQLRACAQVWYSQFESCLSSVKMDEAVQALVAGAEISDIEMFAAQIETTLTNINALDWNGSVDDVLNCVERELDLIDAQQKSVCKKIGPVAKCLS